MKTKQMPLGSFILHPQIKSTYANKESEKLMNHNSDGVATGGGSGTTSAPPLDPKTGGEISSSFMHGKWH